MKNTLNDLNDHLFAQMERLSDEKLDGEVLKQEIARTEAITEVADQIVTNASLQLKALELKAQYGARTDIDVGSLLPHKLNDKP